MLKDSCDSHTFHLRAIAAFTLIEILVVLVIISILAAVLLPVIQSARARGPQTACATNLRQLHMAIVMYASDHDGFIPPYYTRYGDTYVDEKKGITFTWPDRGKELVQALLPYTRSTAVWFCPVDTLAHTDSQEGLVNHRYTSYLTTSLFLFPDPDQSSPKTLDWEGWHWGKDGKTKIAFSASTTIMMMDNLWGCLPGNEVQLPYSHNGRFNRVYLDGHVKSFQRSGNCEWPD